MPSAPCAPRRRDPDGDGYILNGSKTFITNGPYADVIVFICKLDVYTARAAQVLVRPRAWDGLEQMRPLRKMGCTPRRRARSS